MLEGKALIEDTYMPVKMQLQAMAAASEALDLHDVFDCRSIASHIKKVFDMRYGCGWQCVWNQILGVSSLTVKELSYTLHLRLSAS